MGPAIASSLPPLPLTTAGLPRTFLGSNRLNLGLTHHPYLLSAWHTEAAR
jgi:hypothetical protein